MGKIKSWNVTLDEEVVEEARKNLEVGQKLSPVLNGLLKDWVLKKKRKNDQERT